MNSNVKTYNAPSLLLLSGSILTVIAVSGWGRSLMINEIMAIMFSFVASLYIFYHYSRIPPLGKLARLFVFIACYAIIINLMLSEFEFYKIINFTALFGLLIGTGIISGYKWENINTYRTGLLISSFALFVIYLFKPTHLLQGWNSNSSIFMIPILLLGMALIYCSDDASKRIKYISFYCCAFIGFAFISSLENRSSLLALCLFSAIPLFPLVLNNRIIFRVVYITIIATNVISPFFQDFIANSDFFQNIVDLTKGDKSGGFNGRETLWYQAIEMIRENPLLGKGGWRVTYFHNFSLDVLVQYGWLGWAAFITIVVTLLERCFVQGSKYNILLYAFVALLLMNTYENAFLANSFFTISPYFLTGIAWRYANNNNRYKYV